MALPVPADLRNQEPNVVRASADVRVNPAAVYIETLGSAKSKQTMREALNRVVREYLQPDGGEIVFENLEVFPWQLLNYDLMVLVRSKMLERNLSPATINLHLYALRGVMKQAYLHHYISSDQFQMIQQLKGVRGTRVGSGRALSTIESGGLIHDCDKNDSALGARDAAMLALGIGLGLRRAEIAGITFDSINRADGSILIHGKGNKERLTYPSEQVWELLDKWILHRGYSGVQQVFCVVRKGGHIETKTALTPNTINDRISLLAERYGLKHFSPHDLRRTFATRMLTSGADLNIVKDAMGHASITTTQRYDKRGQELVKNYSQKIEL